MTEIFNPRIIQWGKKTFWQKHSVKIVLGLIAVILISCGYLIYRNYFKVAYQLNSFLPENYLISFELKTDPYNFPFVQQEQLLANPALNQIYLTIKQEVAGYLQTLPKQTSDILSQFQEQILFLTDPENFGLIAKIPDKNLAKQIAAADFPFLFTKVIDQQIFILTNNQTLLDFLINQRVTAQTKPYFSLSFSPWLKINFQPGFFKEKYNNPVLTSFQQISWPLALFNHSYTLEFNSQFRQLQIILKPSEPVNLANSVIINNWFDYLPNSHSLILGMAAAQALTADLERNENLQTLFKELDSYLWLTYQISLSNLIKQLNGPAIFSTNFNDWQIITSIDNQNLAETLLKQYFGQYQPKTQQKRLPDGSIATELINNPESVEFEVYEKDGWHFNLIKNNNKKIGYKIKGNILIVGSFIDNLTSSKMIFNCQKPDILGILSINPAVLNSHQSGFLANFTQITAFQDNSGQINLCFSLPR